MVKKHRNKIILGIVGIVVAGYFPKAHPFSGFKGKTLWDWLSLAGVPMSLAGLGFWLQIQQQQRNEEQLQEEILQNYYDKVSELLVDKNLLAIAAKGDTTTPEERELLDVSVGVIRARTLATLRRLDGNRKGSLIRFLTEAKVISKLSLSLKDADLSKAKLEDINLEGTYLESANFSSASLVGARLVNADFYCASLSLSNFDNANLTRTKMARANLYKATLRRARLVECDISGSDLSFSDLSLANLTGAKLRDTELKHVKLRGSTLRFAIFDGAKLMSVDLRDTIGLTKEQLEGDSPSFLCRTQLPAGIDIDPNRDCERMERK